MIRTIRKGPRIDAAESEYGMPFKDILQAFANDGESMTATAHILGYGGHHALIRIARKLGIAFPKGTQSVGAMSARKAAKSTPARLAAIRLASAANPSYKRIELDGIVDTVAGHARRVGIPYRTALCRLRAGRTPEEAFKRTSYVTQPKNHNHTWRQQIAKGMQ